MFGFEGVIVAATMAAEIAAQRQRQALQDSMRKSLDPSRSGTVMRCTCSYCGSLFTGLRCDSCGAPIKGSVEQESGAEIR